MLKTVEENYKMLKEKYLPDLTKQKLLDKNRCLNERTKALKQL